MQILVEMGRGEPFFSKAVSGSSHQRCVYKSVRVCGSEWKTGSPVKAARAFSYALVSLSLIHAVPDECKLPIDSFQQDDGLCEENVL